MTRILGIGRIFFVGEERGGGVFGWKDGGRTDVRGYVQGWCCWWLVLLLITDGAGEIRDGAIGAGVKEIP
ncbi:MAG TPA: hypothetical protein VLL52_21080 [Anaerolineae bacterium]|nr:hypothetical protein [Anaerolineae bacterium]